jgi:hypothetical protein
MDQEDEWVAWSPHQKVQRNSVFWIHHDPHRKPHLAIVLVGQELPCSLCGNKVRYIAAADLPQRWGTDHLTGDPDFLRIEK